MDINISKHIEPYIPSPKSEYQKRIEIRYWINKIKEAKEKLKELGYEKKAN